MADGVSRLDGRDISEMYLVERAVLPLFGRVKCVKCPPEIVQIVEAVGLGVAFSQVLQPNRPNARDAKTPQAADAHDPAGLDHRAAPESQGGRLSPVTDSGVELFFHQQHARRLFPSPGQVARRRLYVGRYH